MNKTATIIIITGLVIATGIVFFGRSNINTNNDTVTPKIESPTESVQNVEIKDGVQYITINAKGGYSPRVSLAKAGIPTKLIFKTNGAYDCSSSVIIRSLNYQKVLPRTGEEIVDIGVPKANVPLGGTCGMGMYSFSINFN
jgi:plastocyanin domain-containing protein